MKRRILFMKCYYKDEDVEIEITNMEKILKSKRYDADYVRSLVAKQQGKLSVDSIYYKGNISEGNWSLVKDDTDIKKLDIYDGAKEIYGTAEHSERIKDAEYEYVFIPSFYAVKMLILYYIKNPEQAERIYGLKNAIVTHTGKKYIGGLPFVLKYIGGDFKDSRVDFGGLIEELIDSTRETECADFIYDIIDCLNNFYGKDLILERRIKNYNDSKENWFTIDFFKEDELLLNYVQVNDYKILGHNDIKKDFNHLQKGQKQKAKEKIRKTPNHPNNDFPTDSEPLRGDLSGWFSQRISKKDRLVYKKDSTKRTVYIATAYSHYDDATRRVKSTESYKPITI